MKGAKDVILKILIGFGVCAIVVFLFWATRFEVVKFLIAGTLILLSIIAALYIFYVIGRSVVGNSWKKEGR